MTAENLENVQNRKIPIEKVQIEYVTIETSEIIKNLNQNNTTKINIPEGLAYTVPSTTAIRQGDSLSRTLFNMLMNEIIDEARTKDAGSKWYRNKSKY